MNLVLDKILFFTFLFLTLFIQTKLWNSRSGYPYYLSLQKDLNDKMERNKFLKLENTSKLVRVENLKNSIEVVEEEARENFGMIKLGEIYLQTE